jgi:hypothetical protein
VLVLRARQVGTDVADLSQRLSEVAA